MQFIEPFVTHSCYMEHMEPNVVFVSAVSVSILGSFLEHRAQAQFAYKLQKEAERLITVI